MLFNPIGNPTSSLPTAAAPAAGAVAVFCRLQLAILLTLIGGVTETDSRGMRRRGTPHLLVVGEMSALVLCIVVL